MRRSPVHEQLDSCGARWRHHGDFEVAGGFGDVENEVEQIRSGAALCDRSHRGRLRLTGGDRVSFLQGQSTANIATLSTATGRETAFLTGKGKMRGFGTVVAAADALDIFCDPGATTVIRDHLRGFIIMEDAVLDDRTDNTVELGVLGPDARTVLGRLLNTSIPDDLPPANRLHTTLAGQSLEIIATTDVGVAGFAVIAGRHQAAALWQALSVNLPLVGDDALEVVRVEAGTPSFGIDIDDDTIPIEAGLLHLIDYDKGCFTGYEVVARIRTYGHVNRHLVGLKHGGDKPAVVGATVVGEGKVVGRITSSVRSAKFGCAISLAMLRREVSVPGTRVEIDHTPAEVVRLPFGS